MLLLGIFTLWVNWDVLNIFIQNCVIIDAYLKLYLIDIVKVNIVYINEHVVTNKIVVISLWKSESVMIT